MTKKYRMLSVWCSALALVLPGAVFAQSPGAEGPDVDLGLVAGGEGGTYRGWPIVTEISVAHPKAALAAAKGETVQPISVSVPSGRWTALVKLVVRNSQGEIQQWPYRLLTTVGPSLTLDTEQRGELTVVLSPEATATPAAGRYTMQVFLDSRNGTNDASWKGVASSQLEFELKEAPTTPSDTQTCQKGYVFSEYHKSLGQLTTAASMLDTALTQAPDELLCLVSRAELADQLGDNYGAIDHYHRAIEAKARLPQDADGESGSGSLLHRCLGIVQKLPPSERHPLNIFCSYVTCEERMDAGTCPSSSKPASTIPGRGSRTKPRSDKKGQ
ncbi:hypothetical protein HUA74_40895 [Myxococcus sp. CA051A]|uniref:hypothetical protein n=1 Tax=unclassified Myxococcus TaxID=2648731 RepID=UPI00157AD40A|nr:MULTISPECIES: hypothetical protein [unclassified Myxococcus]NTX51516.1 hypothetical protein [Myxococcus sp. CA039A]NTX67029.1 hypothetical protein [Myxococcus sp. CA051A]